MTPPPEDPLLSALRAFVGDEMSKPSGAAREAADRRVFARAWRSLGRKAPALRGPRSRLPVLVSSVVTIAVVAVVVAVRSRGVRRDVATGLPPPVSVVPPEPRVSASAEGAAQVAQTATPSAFGRDVVSHWLEPWRAAVRTRPAATMRQAAGVVVRFEDDAAWLPARLAEGRFARLRLPVPWSSFDYDDPDRLHPQFAARLRAWLEAMRSNGLRPLLALQANATAPTPLRHGRVHVAEAAAAGAQQMALDAASLAAVVPGRTGFEERGVAAAVLITAVHPSGAVELSRPLGAAIPAGPRAVTTLRYAPFAAPPEHLGGPSPAFEDTMGGWLRFVRAVCAEARAAVGAGGFDLELWNDGSLFFDHGSYTGTNDDARGVAIRKAILTRTAQWLADPAHHVVGTRLVDSLSLAQAAAAVDVPGVHAVGRHVVARTHRFPALYLATLAPSVTAWRTPNGGLVSVSGKPRWDEAFTPAYDVSLPELPLSALPARDRLFPDLFERAPGAAPLWLTSFNLSPVTAQRALGVRFTDTQSWRYRAKSILRALSAYVGTGVETLFFYSATHPDVALVDARAVDTGGEVMVSVSRFMSAFDGPAQAVATRTLRLDDVDGCATCIEVPGAGRPDMPAVSRRDLVAFFPFQIDERTFVAPAYVMTKSLARPRRPTAADDPARFDLPPEMYRLTVGGVRGEAATVTAFDPHSGAAVPTVVTTRTAKTITIEVALTDTPRLLRIME